MSKGLSFFLVILTGILLTLGFFAIKSCTDRPSKLPNGVTMFDEPVPFTEARSFEVFQVVFEDAALAQSEQIRPYTGSIYYSDPVVLIISDHKNACYDDQIVKAPKYCKVMQVGTYKYQAQMGWKTVPIVQFVKIQ